MLLYLHIPFCRSKCRYCAFYSRPLGGSEGTEALELWARTLTLDLRQWGERLGSPSVDTVFFGGGTPSLVPPRMMEHLLHTVSQHFSLSSDAEVSMEANPESLYEQNARAFKAAGVNRVSLGVQALDDHLLQAIGRVHSKNDALRAYDALRRSGFSNVGLDLIWGLPGEDLKSWNVQLEEAARLRPEHLSCYGLTLEDGTPLFQERHTLALPDEDTQAAMYESTGDTLARHGYHQYEISNYAMPGFECRHNKGYWTGRDYLGLGPSAVSTMGDRRWEQPSSLTVWADDVHQKRFDSRAQKLSFLERAEELVMLRLRTAEGLSFHSYTQLTGKDFLQDNKIFLDALLAEGMVETNQHRIRLTRRGMLLSNSIIEGFFEHIPDTEEER